MSRAPIESRPNTAQWLITAREAAGFTNAQTFLAAVKESEGSAPSYSTYAQWESGSVTPRSSTLAAIRRFHAAKGGQPAPAKPAPDLATALLALAEANAGMVRELEAMRKEREAWVLDQAELRATVDQLVRSALARGDMPERVARAARPRSAGSAQ